MSKHLRIETNSSQMARLSQSYGALASVAIPEDEENREMSELQAEQITDFAATLSSTSTVYSMADGCMLPTREGEQGNDWKEVKLGRIFSDTGIENVDKHHNRITSSIYCASLESSALFCLQMNLILSKLMEQGHTFVFINDGGQWLWNWINTYYPNSVQILDYYHACEYLNKCSKLLHGLPKQATEWFDAHQKLLLEDGIGDFLIELQQTIDQTTGEVKKNELQKIYNYLKKHEKRMLYKTFRDKGYLIGSGAIESAHRVVLQKRLKQSGQRWTKEGAQNIINLRVLEEANQWDKLISIIRKQENQYQYKSAA